MLHYLRRLLLRTCTHPLRALRFDGLWTGFGPTRASVTCRLCQGSFTIPVRGDVADRAEREADQYAGRMRLVPTQSQVPV